MNTHHHPRRGTRPLRRGLAALGAAALAVGIGIAAAPAANASSPYDWQISVRPHTVQLGATTDVTWTLACQNAAGCDVDPDLHIQAWSVNGATISLPGGSSIRTGGSIYVGSCQEDGSTHIDCAITNTVHLGDREFLYLAVGDISNTLPWSLQTPASSTSAPMLSFGFAPSPGTRRVDTINANLASGSPSADLALTKTGPATVAPGAPVSYEIAVANNGPDASAGYTVTDVLPAGLINPTTTTPGCSISAGTLTCTSSNTLSVGIHDTYRVTGTAPQSGQLSNTASVTGVTADPTPGNNSDTVVTTIDAPPAANPSGDWGTSGSGLMAPGTNKSYDQTFTCLSAAGCDYAPGMTITDHAAHGAYSPGTNTVYLNGQAGIGTCTVTTADIDCGVTATGHANQGDTISTAGISYMVDGGVAPDTQVFAITFTPPAGWTGDDASNNVFPISTPPEAGAPLINGAVAGGIGGVVLLLGGALVLLRRRKVAIAEPAA